MTTKQSLIQSGLTPDKAQYWAKHLDGLPSVPAVRWQQAGAALLQAGEPFAVHRAVYQEIFSHANADAGPPAAWSPAPGDIATANITQLQQQLGLDSSEALHRWSVTNRNEFWARAIELVGVRFRQPYDAVVDAASGIETPRWLPGAEMNITDSCFAHAPEAPAIIFQGEDGPLQSWTVAELEALVNRVANGLAAMGLAAGDAIAVDMPMTAESVAIYLGIIKMGGACYGATLAGCTALSSGRAPSRRQAGGMCELFKARACIIDVRGAEIGAHRTISQRRTLFRVSRANPKEVLTERRPPRPNLRKERR